MSIFEDEEEENSLDFDQGPIKGLTGRHWARKISSDYFLLSAANEPAQVFTQLLFKRSFETAETIWEIYSIYKYTETFPKIYNVNFGIFCGDLQESAAF